MSDFDDVVYVETDDKPMGPGVAPSGDHPAKIISAEKYKSQQGNWTLKMTFQIAGGNYRDHNEWYNLWDPREDIKQISTDSGEHEDCFAHATLGLVKPNTISPDEAERLQLGYPSMGQLDLRRLPLPSRP